MKWGKARRGYEKPLTVEIQRNGKGAGVTAGEYDVTLTSREGSDILLFNPSLYAEITVTLNSGNYPTAELVKAAVTGVLKRNEISVEDVRIEYK